ncbi:DUF488 domain-containing protein [Ornithinibacillus californiensis]|uniref:DUF488 domain-containing protein n=1 Tax=Ornithinibacillus californiensis TaxID=161536 RepID=UPI00064DE979|nr:DUF488 family protein [Ornithinibacillus californiensis]
MVEIVCKRIYSDVNEDDGLRILVDRLWPRVFSKEKAKLDYWLKEIAPSNELRKSFHGGEYQFESFKEKYLEELKRGLQKETLNHLFEIVSNQEGRVTLLFGAKDEENNQAVVLKELLEAN